MKHLFSVLLAALTAMMLAAPAFADMVWEPMDNPFFQSRTAGCDYEGRSYYANGKKGFVTLWDAPDGSIVKAQYENGEKLWVGYTYRQEWALVNCRDGRDALSGWVPLSDLYLIYDHISFEEEYGDQFRDYNGEFADYEAAAGKEFRLYLYEYPLAGIWRDSIAISQEALDALRGRSEDLGELISKVYTDSNNDNWGYVEWLYGARDFWFRLDNPTNDGVMYCDPYEEAEAMIVEELIANGEIIPPREPVMPGASYTPYVLVAAVVIVTGCLLIIFYKKKK